MSERDDDLDALVVQIVWDNPAVGHVRRLVEMVKQARDEAAQHKKNWETECQLAVALTDELKRVQGLAPSAFGPDAEPVDEAFHRIMNENIWRAIYDVGYIRNRARGAYVRGWTDRETLLEEDAALAPALEDVIPAYGAPMLTADGPLVHDGPACTCCARRLAPGIDALDELPMAS